MTLAMRTLAPGAMPETLMVVPVSQLKTGRPWAATVLEVPVPWPMLS